MFAQSAVDLDFTVVNFENVRRDVEVPDIPVNFASFSVLHLNAGTGGLAKSGQLELLEETLRGDGSKVDVVVVGELWLRSFDFSSYTLSDFTMVACGRETGARGGGVAVFVRSTFTFVPSAVFSSPDGYVQIARVHVRRGFFECCVLGLYSSNYSHCRTLLNELDGALSLNDSLPCVILGDANVDLRSSTRGSEYLGFFNSHGFRHLISKVTRPSSGTCLDHAAVRGFDALLDISPFVWQTPILLRPKSSCHAHRKRTGRRGGKIGRFFITQ